MAKYYDEQTIRDIESRVDIVDLIGESVSLTRKGNRYWGLCPFHGEKTASFCVSRDRQMYYCFGCHEGGNVYSFLMKTQGIGFPEALKILAQRAGVKLPETAPAHRNREKEELLRLHQAAAGYYQGLLKSVQGKHARLYLQQRSITEESIEKFGLGYANENWSGLCDWLMKKGFSQSALEKSGLARKSEKNGNIFDLLRNRIIFPIYQYDQAVIAFGGRTMEKDVQPKYLNSPETPIFSKRKNLYGLSWARNSMREQSVVFLVEGYMDCLKMSQAGIQNVVASLGTAFTSEQASLLHRYVERVVLLYDGDDAGQRETLRASGLLQQEGLGVDILTLPNDMDPDEFVTAYGSKGLYDFLKENRQSIISFKLGQWLKNHEGRPALEEKSQLIRGLRTDFQRLPGEMERDYHIELLAMKLGIPENLVRRELKAEKTFSNKPKKTNKTSQKWNNNTENYTLTERVVAAMLLNPVWFEQISSQVGLEIFTNEQDRLLLKMVAKERQQEPAFDLKDLQFRALQDGLENRLARLQMIIETKWTADQILIDDFIARVKKLQERSKWRRLLKEIQQMDEKGTNSDGIKKLLFQINQVFHAERKEEEK